MFNLIVGTGALTMPKAFAAAGWVVSVSLISFLAFMRYALPIGFLKSITLSFFLSFSLLRLHTPASNTWVVCCLLTPVVYEPSLRLYTLKEVY